jgi:hypothetical protein
MRQTRVQNSIAHIVKTCRLAELKQSRRIFGHETHELTHTLELLLSFSATSRQEAETKPLSTLYYY